MDKLVVGIDLGTSNSSIAVIEGDQPRIIEIDGARLMPSAVGLSAEGALLVGRAARNQRRLAPERTILSVKRRMGEAVSLSLGEARYTPVEISAMILRRLKNAAEASLGRPIDGAVITVPAYFTNAQRTATREAGAAAGLNVIQILNEPTAASLCYVFEDRQDKTVMVYDLGGGTFDVSIIRTRGEVTEVLASHGDMHLGGDDFDALIFEHLHAAFNKAEGVDFMDDLRAQARVAEAAEALKLRLSSAEHGEAIEEHLIQAKGASRHLKASLSRLAYEGLIEALLEKTKDSVQLALHEADLLARDLDEVILVGGATRTPRVAQMLTELLGQAPRMDINPDEAVTLGAALHAARLSGDDRRQILVDITPFSFGTSYLDIFEDDPDAYKVIIPRGAALPCAGVETFYTIHPGQAAVEANIYQGEAPRASENLLLGQFMVEDLDRRADANSPIRFELALGLDGILDVRVTEIRTGLEKRVVIHDAFRQSTEEALAQTRARIEALLPSPRLDARPGLDVSPGLDASPRLAPPPNLDTADRGAWVSAAALVEKAQKLLPKLDELDAEEVEELIEALVSAMNQGDITEIQAQGALLADTLFYLE
ncbi:Hsp70 family protein [Myxococcota bacterium]|nr:Hsp70 family protein [Myxococcota bacterium]MBU1429241.1 Hsp70 family protein [Myxococcota bacterium]MBU1897992.1 Hsp70 family protein [Myxococcota bacterium]